MSSGQWQPEVLGGWDGAVWESLHSIISALLCSSLTSLHHHASLPLSSSLSILHFSLKGGDNAPVSRHCDWMPSVPLEILETCPAPCIFPACINTNKPHTNNTSWLVRRLWAVSRIQMWSDVMCVCVSTSLTSLHWLWLELTQYCVFFYIFLSGRITQITQNLGFIKHFFSVKHLSVSVVLQPRLPY